MRRRLIFEETQSFVGTWGWYLVIGIAVLVTGLLMAKIVLSSPSNETWISLIISSMVFGGVIILLATSRLYVTVYEDAICYRFPPYVSREKPLGKENIREMYVRHYKPLREYGGHGYRFSIKSGRALGISGNTGLQLILNNGKRILLGTQKPDSMHTVVRRLKENWEMNG